jgi:hypothetical protein
MATTSDLSRIAGMGSTFAKPSKVAGDTAGKPTISQVPVDAAGPRPRPGRAKRESILSGVEGM